LIPRQIHIIWVGDQSRRPDNCIATWVDRNPAWSVRVWKNEDAAGYGWINADHMTAMARRELNGVADMMRWEILVREGGFVVDADSFCIRPLDDWLFECDAFACWENELARPGLIAAGYVASAPGNPFFVQIVRDINAEPSVIHDLAWQTVGPKRLTDAFHRYAYSGLTIYPSHYFIPEHFTGRRYSGAGPVYARQEWGTTRGTYGELHRKILDPPINPASRAAPVESGIP
jgi:mannosyltransferase OCH1-like enzyme